MITNASLDRVDLPDAPTTGGDQAWVAGQPIVGVRCAVVDANSAVQYLVDQLKLETSAVLYVESTALPGAERLLLKRAMVTVTPDDQVQQQFIIEHVLPRTSGLSHFQCLLRSL